MQNQLLSLPWVDEYLPRLSFAIRGGVRDWFEVAQVSARVAIAHSSRSRASMICDLCGQRAREAFQDIPDQVLVEVEYETAQLRFLNQDVVLKFNQLDSGLRVHTPSTDRAKGFLYQQDFLPFTETVAPSAGLSLIGGYRLDGNHTQLLQATVTCQHGQDVIWHRDIPEPPPTDRFSLIQPINPGRGPTITDRVEGRRADGA